MTQKCLITLLLLISSIFQIISQKYIYISDAGNFQNGPYQIMRFKENETAGEIFIKNSLSWPQDILFLPNKNQVLISNLSANSIEAYNAKTGEHINRFASGIEGPTRMRISKEGFIYVLQWFGDGKVKKFDINGNFVGEATQTGVPRSIGFDWDNTGDLYISSFNGKFVERFDKDGKSKGKFIGSGLFGPTNIQFNAEGQLIVLDYNSGRVLLFAPNGVFIKTLINGLPQCEGIQIQSDGNIIISYVLGVKMYDKNGVFKKTLVESGSNNLLNPNAVLCSEIIPSNTVESPDKIFIDFLQAVGENKYIVSPKVDKQFSIVNVFNNNGVLVKTHDFIHSECLDLSGLIGGIYVAHTIMSNNIQVTQKLVILK